ncbi:type VI secretion system protein ImpF [Novosphingobium sp. CF614]|uniref:type VI secretion system baseplate subunit TssE n=1 Tax=Novosphingobium sp. CF614 TaxID=1884364 RepID=UPI0008E95992|nr:type VI secretion system baseplate subunit TssE [Novosphingobium sp. CF614]SFF95179.1 type VI secretion system protein ImpF [Novosphingobium sp. CF614]
MARIITQSLIDRLIDDDPQAAADPQETEDEAVTRYKIALRRDLESLLNTKRPYLPLVDRYEGLDRTILGYGIPDLSTEDMSVPVVRDRTRRVIAQVIREHEPRLSDIEIELDEGPTSRGMRLRISAVLNVVRSEETVVYEASVRPGDRTIEVNLSG